MRYEIRALQAGRVETLLIEAASADDARQQASAAEASVLGIRALGRARPPSRFDLTLFGQELIELLDAGLALTEALEALAEREPAGGDEARIAALLLARLREGLGFSAALACQPEYFPPLFIGLVRAAEQTSELQAALGRYLEYRSRFDQLRHQIVAALIYPAVLLVVGSLVSLFLLGFVVPRFAMVYRGGQRSLPWASQLLLDWGEFVAGHGQILLLALPLGLIGALLLLRRAMRRGWLEDAARRLPGIGRRITIFRLCQLYLAVGTLINGGTPAMAALDLASGVAAPAMRPALAAVASSLRQGLPLSQALSAQGLTTPVALRLLQAGEGAGRIGELLLRAARYHDKALARDIDGFSRLFEPLLMTAIGLVVGLIVVLLYMPIFDLVGSLQ